jgi:hypothetical protein
MSVHQFDTEHVKEVGFPAAVIYRNLCYWVDKNKADGRHNHDGTFWTYSSVKAMAELFDYLSESQIRRALLKLEEKGWIITGNFNKSAYDRTTWYSCPIHLSKSSNGFAASDEPIPDGNPDSKPDTPVSAGERERTVEHNTPPSPDEGDAKAIWTEYAPKLIEVLGETKVELIGDRSRFAKAVLNSPGWTARQVAEAILAHCRAEASDQDERKYRKALHKILMAGTWQAKLGQTAPEAHEIEDLVAMTERQTREGLEAYKRKLEARKAA